MKYEDRILNSIARKLKENSSNGKIYKKDAFMVLARRFRFDRDLGKITFNELVKRKKMKRKNGAFVINL